ncbi:MAG TPA: hypothetical protein VIN07_06310 [Flavipsychrobacter sp.]
MENKQKNIDWVILLFLLLFTNQAMFSVKLLGLAFVYLARPNFRFGINKGRVPLFIPLLLLLSLANFFLFVRDFSSEYIAAFVAGNMLWIFSFLSFHQIKLSVERYGVITAHKTLKVFIVLHFLFCIGQLVRIMVITDTLNPYVGLEFPYGMSTGDNVFGTFMENSLYNVTVSGFLAIYFLFKRAWFHAMLASVCVILVFSNFGTIVFGSVLLGLFFTGTMYSVTGGKLRWLKKIAPPGNFAIYIPAYIFLIVILYVTVSPDNADYFVAKVKNKIFSIEVEGKNNYKGLIADQKPYPEAFIMTASEYHALKNLEKDKISFTTATKQSATTDKVSRVTIKRNMTKTYVMQLQGKTLAVLETMQFLKSSPIHLFFGAGTTRFSSHIAQKMAGYDSSRLFMHVLPRFVSPEYRENHVLLIEERIKSEKAYFSTANFPDSFYNQIFGEYGLLGAFLFVFFYVGYFFKSIHKLSYGLWLFVILLPFAHLSYIFDTMCVMPFFEWLLLIDIESEK